MPRYRHRRHKNRPPSRWLSVAEREKLERRFGPKRRRRNRLPCWQYLLSFAIVGGIIAAIVLLLANYTGDPPNIPAAPAADKQPRTLTIMGTPVATATPTVAIAPTSTPAPTITPATAEALATARSRSVNPSPTPTRLPVTPTVSRGPSSKGYVGGYLLSTSEIARLTVVYTNLVRQEHGLGVLIDDPAITAIAQAHSKNMVDTGIFDHDIGGKGPTERALAAGYDCRAYSGDGSYSYGLSENIAQRPRVLEWSGSGSRSTWRASKFRRDEQAVAESLVDGWMNSSGHRRNILDPQARRIGVGVAVELFRTYGQVGERFYATQNFSECQ